MQKDESFYALQALFSGLQNQLSALMGTSDRNVTNTARRMVTHAVSETFVSQYVTDWRKYQDLADKAASLGAAGLGTGGHASKRRGCSAGGRRHEFGIGGREWRHHDLMRSWSAPSATPKRKAVAAMAVTAATAAAATAVVTQRPPASVGRDSVQDNLQPQVSARPCTQPLCECSGKHPHE